jgi:hypothetical protein
MFFSLLLSGQSSIDSLVYKMSNSDSIVVVSHEDLRVYGKPGESDIIRKIIEDGKPNQAIIREKLNLDKATRDSLIFLVKSQKYDPIFGPAFCFDPHHTIYIYRNGSFSYLDVCFGCNTFATSDDIYVDDLLFHSYEIWKVLKNFLKRKGFIYKMER